MQHNVLQCLYASLTPLNYHQNTIQCEFLGATLYLPGKRLTLLKTYPCKYIRASLVFPWPWKQPRSSFKLLDLISKFRIAFSSFTQKTNVACYIHAWWHGRHAQTYYTKMRACVGHEIIPKHDHDHVPKVWCVVVWMFGLHVMGHKTQAKLRTKVNMT